MRAGHAIKILKNHHHNIMYNQTNQETIHALIMVTKKRPPPALKLISSVTEINGLCERHAKKHFLSVKTSGDLIFNTKIQA